MEYKVLYRKYRPEDFSGIIGQDYIVSILKNSINSSKISHAYIFSGPRGTGKTSTAKVFAKAINCQNPTPDGPCNKCPSCLAFKENADIIEIDAASNNGVDEIREIINNIKLVPAYSQYKVYIIDEVHMLSTSAFNALLLTLEEPPKRVVFILATTNIEAVPITILSRCQRFDFHKISLNDIKKRLEYVANQEKIDITPEAIEEISYISDGGLRDALSILDQLTNNVNKITIEDVISHFGSVSKKQIDDFYNTIITNDITKFIEMVNNFKNLAIDYKLLIRKMLEKIESEAIASKSRASYNGLPYNKLKEMAFSLAEITNYVNINIDPYLLIQISLLNYFPGNNFSTSSPTLDSFKIPVNTDQKPSKPQNSDFTHLKEIRINNCFANAQKKYLQEIKDMWPNFLKSITNKQLLNIIEDVQIVASSDKVAILTSQLETSTSLINENILALATEFNKIFNLDYNFIALTPPEWQTARLKYIEDLKNNVTYKYIEEPKEETNNVNSSPTSEEPSPDIETEAFDIFDKEKIEIE